MTKTNRPAPRGLRQRLAIGAVALLAAALVSGCGAEGDQSKPDTVKAETPVPGMSKDDYSKQMQEKAQMMNRPGGGGGAPPGMPTGPGGMPPGPGGAPGAPPSAPPSPP